MQEQMEEEQMEEEQWRNMGQDAGCRIQEEQSWLAVIGKIGYWILDLPLLHTTPTYYSHYYCYYYCYYYYCYYYYYYYYCCCCCCCYHGCCHCWNL